MLGMTRKFAKSDEGSVAVATALLVPILLGMGAMAVDVSYWFQQKRTLQTAVDSAALAGAFEIANRRSESAAENAALKEAINNGYSSVVGNNLNIEFTTDNNNYPLVKVTLSQNMEGWFSGVFSEGYTTVRTTATARVEGSDGPYCFLSLNTWSQATTGVAGSATIDAQQCGIANNSDSESAIYLNGNVFVNVGDVKVVGNYTISGGAATFQYEKMRANASATADPYQDLNVPTFASCTGSEKKSQYKKGTTVKSTFTGDITLSPGTFCGGVTVTGNNSITLTPGVYVMDGGSFDVSGGGSIVGQGVTIILTNGSGSTGGCGGNCEYGNFDVSGGKDIYFSAPTTGPYAGITVFQDRDAPAGPRNTLTGNAGLTLDGVFYSPSRAVDFGGNGKAIFASSKTCSKIIADAITFHGNPHIGRECDGKDTASIGMPVVLLVE